MTYGVQHTPENEPATAEDEGQSAETRLNQSLECLGRVAVAVSGGVDSTTLAYAAHRRLPGRAVLFHAVSAAVPAEATARLRELAAQERWALRIIEAGELADPDYVRNPADRCFFCKSNLYTAIRRLTSATIVSGTNLDDLEDVRPGLKAAADHAVRHPFVEAGIDKAVVRLLARRFGLVDVAELPASPCLSSRIETGVAILPEALAMIHGMERAIATFLDGRGDASVGPSSKPARCVRCRLRREGLVLELDEASLAMLTADDGAPVRAELTALARAGGFATPPRYTQYRRGSAFLHGAHMGSVVGEREPRYR